MLADPEVRLSLTGRSGPLVVEIEYRVDQDNARAFHNVMQDVQLCQPAQRRLWLVDRARHRRSRIVDRALSLPDLARLSAPAQPPDPIRARTASAREGFPSRPRSGAGPPHAGTAVRIGALEGRNPRPRRQRSFACCDRRGRRRRKRRQRRLSVRPSASLERPHPRPLPARGRGAQALLSRWRLCLWQAVRSSPTLQWLGKIARSAAGLLPSPLARKPDHRAKADAGGVGVWGGVPDGKLSRHPCKPCATRAPE